MPPFTAFFFLNKAGIVLEILTETNQHRKAIKIISVT